MVSNMATSIFKGLALALVAAAVVACGSSGGDTVDKDYLKNAEAVGKIRREIFVRSNMDYDKMTPEDKKAYLDTFQGNEENAKKFWDLMKNPPSPYGSGLPTGNSAGQ